MISNYLNLTGQHRNAQHLHWKCQMFFNWVISIKQNSKICFTLKDSDWELLWTSLPTKGVRGWEMWPSPSNPMIPPTPIQYWGCWPIGHPWTLDTLENWRSFFFCISIISTQLSIIFITTWSPQKKYNYYIYIFLCHCVKCIETDPGKKGESWQCQV